MHGRNYIGGRWVDTPGGGMFESRNPANTEEVLGSFPMSHREEADQAVASAKERGWWRKRQASP
jgi:aldehyde dehydrogenase (NAD+)